VVTTVVMPEGRGGDAFRALALERFDIALGSGLSKLADKVFRIGHLGDLNDLTLLGALAGVEMSLGAAGVAHREGGVQAAMSHLATTSAG
jgi:alanine-glyoxylate transaminase/serine-glyoxylate transaminase/serine-pyruvate transaminase